MDVGAELVPQVVGDAALRILHAALAGARRAAGRAQVLIHSHDDVGNPELGRRPRQPVAAARPARAPHQTRPAQAAEELFKV